MQRRVFERLLAPFLLGACWPQYIRVSPRRIGWLIDGRFRAASAADGPSGGICRSLVLTVGYCEWLAAGGHPDLGRWIAVMEEAKLAGDP